MNPTRSGVLREGGWLAVVPALATLFEGGGSAAGLALWHGSIACLVIGVLLRPGASSPGRAVAGAPMALWALFLVWVAAGAIRAPYAYAAFLNAIELAAVTAVLVLAGRNGNAILQFAPWAVGAAGAAQALLALIQRAGGTPRPAGTFLNPNHLGGFLVAAMLLLAGEALAAGDGRRRHAALGLAALCAPGLLVAGSRGALLAGLVGGAWLGFSVWNRVSPRRRIALVVVALALIAPATFRLAQRLQDTDPFLFHRVKIWRAALGPVVEDPLWGSGPGQFAIAAAAHQFDDGHGPLRFDKAFRISHSDLVRVPAEFGLPAAALAAFGLLAFVQALRRGRGTEPVPPGPVAALLAIGAQALVDNPSRWPALYLLASLLAGSLASRAVAPGARLRPAIRAALAVVVGLVFVVGELGPTVAHLKARELPAGRLDPGQLDVLRLVTLLNPVQPEFARRRVDHLLASDAGASLAAYADAREAAERAVRLSPRDSRYHWGLARVEGQACLRLFETADSRDRAYEHLERAQDLSPTDARIPLDTADLALAVGDVAHARRMTRRALALEPQAVAAHFMHARVLLEERAPGDRAAAALARAEALAIEHAAVAEESRYARELMTLDPARVAALRERVRLAARAE